MTELHQLSATQLAQHIRTGQIRSVDAVAACFAQIEQWDDRLRAFITLCQEQAEQAAIEADQAIQQGRSIGCLHGVPIAIKDLTATAGIRTTYGSLLYEKYVPTQDELCVARLRAAGAILIGKTSVPEFGFGTGTANPLSGITRNPYDDRYTCGDSSGGSAVAVSTGMCYLAHGSDMGGSVRTPASFCGIVGLRPSIGRIPRVPKPLAWESLITDGVLARNVEDATLMLTAMAGFDGRDPLAIDQSWSFPDWPLENWEHTRMGWSANLGIAVIDPEVAALSQKAIEAIAQYCPQIEVAHPDCAEAPETFETLRAAFIHHTYHHLLTTKADAVNETLQWEIEQGIGLSAADYLQAETQRGRLYRRFLKFFEQYDFLITVSASIPPFPITQTAVLEIDGIKLRNIIDYLTVTYTISLTGLPVISIPVAWTAAGLPIGLQIVGKPHSETRLLQFAYFLQEMLNFRHQWPAG